MRSRIVIVTASSNAMPSTARGVLARWEAGWELLFRALTSLQPNVSETVTIRGEPHTVVQAINRHCRTTVTLGQIVLLAKHFAGPNCRL